MGKTQNKIKKRIIYIGNYRQPFTTEQDIKKSFEALGWEVNAIQEDQMREQTIDDILAVEKNYDFILYTRTWAQTDRLWRMLLSRTKSITVSVHLDLYLGLDRGRNLDNDSFFRSDYVFSADGGHQDEFKQMGINHIWLPPAILKDSCYLGDKRKEFSQDVIFVGSFNYHAEWRYRQLLINWLKANYGERFELYPNHRANCIRGKDLNDLYNSAKVIVGDSTYSPNYWSDRAPETIGRGGFIIHPYTEGFETNFEAHKHYIPYEYGDFGQLKMLIDYFLEHADERDAIRTAGLEHVKKNHTYQNRVETILKTLCLYP